MKIQTGEVDTALVYGFGKSSAGVLRRTLALQLDPYTMTPLWPDTVSLAGAAGARRHRRRACGTRRRWPRSWSARCTRRREATSTPIRQGGSSVDDAARRADVRRPAAQARLRAGHRRRRRDRARRRRPGPRRRATARRGSPGFEHRSTPRRSAPRDLTRSASHRRGRPRLVDLDGVEVAELHAPFSHQELILRSAARPRRRRDAQPVGRRADRQPDVRRAA